jgi:hypothetical protein
MSDSSLGYVGPPWVFLGLIVAICSYNLATVGAEPRAETCVWQSARLLRADSFLVRTGGENGAIGLEGESWDLCPPIYPKHHQDSPAFPRR